MLKILLVEDDYALRLTTKLALESREYSVAEACDGQEAVDFIQEHPDYDAVLLDVNMPRMSGIEALTAIKAINPRIFCLVMTAYVTVQDAIAAIKLGAFDYLEKPVSVDRIFAMIDRALSAQAMAEVAKFSAPQLDLGDGRNMVGRSSAIQRVYDVIYKLCKVDTAVLIRGESGTGKELVAKALHYNSHRKKAPFVALNCAAIPESLIESELFGHERGSFTGADKKRIGKFHLANGGTLFLDEIGDMTAHMQVKLLRVLQDKCITPVGSNTEIKLDVRLVAATSRPLEELMRTGAFRPDLFYRLNVLPIHLPPLRERLEDLEELCDYLIQKFNLQHDRGIRGIDAKALSALKAYNWPGNIRELENVLEHAFIVESDAVLRLSSLPSHIIGESIDFVETQDATEEDEEDDDGYGRMNFPILKERFERDFIMQALKYFGGRINKTAQHTQMTKMTLLRKLEKYGINPSEFRQ